MSPYKGKVAHRSWQHLPPELVRLIVTHALLDISANAFIPQTWDQRDQWLPRMVFNVLRDTDTMEHFMLVCPPWSIAREYFAFVDERVVAGEVAGSKRNVTLSCWASREIRSPTTRSTEHHAD